ncbi:MAG: hypothetical protein HGB26_00005, partial [Desulfobulbaceae bacterium]|nr:hypothetical protein [Desulfobulbaceae bacterium]
GMEAAQWHAEGRYLPQPDAATASRGPHRASPTAGATYSPWESALAHRAGAPRRQLRARLRGETPECHSAGAADQHLAIALVQGQGDAIGQAELAQDGYFVPLQQGIIDSAERFAAAAALLGYSFGDWKPWVNYLLVNKLAFPRAKEVANIRHRHHLDDFHGSKKPKSDFGKGVVPLWSQSRFRLKFDPLLRIRCFLRHLRWRLNE